MPRSELIIDAACPPETDRISPPPNAANDFSKPYEAIPGMKSANAASKEDSRPRSPGGWPWIAPAPATKKKL
jgi:hypothetical protein